jgi:organic radical activating enzyme
MSTFDVKKNTAICALPWIHEYKTISGNTAPCCQGDGFLEGETIAGTRESMLKGIKPRACNNCYKTEQESGWSPRIQETNDWIGKFGEPDADHPSIQYVDVRYDPTCNLKCKTCGPHSSTLWQKEKGMKITVNDENKRYLNEVDKTILKKVYLAGGEPTYIKGYLQFLQELSVVNPLCEVIINTNLKRLPDAWKDIITKFKNLTVICSCDAIETLGTYVRYPLGWTEFEENVKFVSENANFLQFNLVASNLTVHRLYETCTWMKQYSKHINLSVLRDPAVFSESAVPVEHRDVYVDNVKKLSKFPVSIYYAARFRNEVNYLIKKYSTAEYSKLLHQQLQDEISEQDSHRTMKLADVDDFLYSWIHVQ